jgi:hypothetical protein
MSLDESIGKIEVDPKEEASVVEVFQDVLDKLSDVGKKDKLLKFFKLVQDGKFHRQSISKCIFFVKSPLESWHLLKVDRVFISFMFKSVKLSILQKTINKTSKSPHAFAMCSIRTDLLKQGNENIDSL